MIKCETCKDDKFILIGCCSGHMCVCLGMPVDIEPCKECNGSGELDASDDLKNSYPFFFRIDGNKKR